MDQRLAYRCQGNFDILWGKGEHSFSYYLTNYTVVIYVFFQCLLVEYGRPHPLPTVYYVADGSGHETFFMSIHCSG